MPAMVGVGRSQKREHDRRNAIANKKHDEEVRLQQVTPTPPKEGDCIAPTPGENWQGNLNGAVRALGRGCVMVSCWVLGDGLLADADG